MKISTSFMQPNTPNRLKRDKVFVVVERDGAECKNCGETNPDHLTIDHIQPKSLGGADKPYNMQILCKKCHRIKDRWTSVKAQHLRVIKLKEEKEQQELRELYEPVYDLPPPQ